MNTKPTSPSLPAYVKPPAGELRQRLTPMQFQVTQKDATEPPFHNAFWDNHAAGIYVDVVTGEPLFSSLDKFESGTGWPSFSRPIEDGHVVSKSDRTLGMVRTEVRSSAGDSHLGHVFDDGPLPTGLRYCINSASLRFIPVDRLEAEGYGPYARRFGRAEASPALEPATANSCTIPPPGERPGCESTLQTAVLGGGPGAEAALRSVPGVLEVDRGSVERLAAVRVVFDPSQLDYAGLLDRWLAVLESTDGRPVVVCTSDEQRRVADAWSRQHAGGSDRIVVRSADEDAFAPSG